jgi:hypothetical protein
MCAMSSELSLEEFLDLLPSLFVCKDYSKKKMRKMFFFISTQAVKKPKIKVGGY